MEDEPRLVGVPHVEGTTVVKFTNDENADVPPEQNDCTSHSYNVPTERLLSVTDATLVETDDHSVNPVFLYCTVQDIAPLTAVQDNVAEDVVTEAEFIPEGVPQEVTDVVVKFPDAVKAEDPLEQTVCTCHS